MSEKVFTITCQCINCGAISKEEYERGVETQYGSLISSKGEVCAVCGIICDRYVLNRAPIIKAKENTADNSDNIVPLLENNLIKSGEECNNG